MKTPDDVAVESIAIGEPNGTGKLIKANGPKDKEVKTTGPKKDIIDVIS